VANRSHTKRLALNSLAALCCAVIGPLLIAGCQSNAQYDQAARELRMQEDQLYAMEDYVTQYQELLCKYRSENAELRRQLAARGGATTPATRRQNGTLPTPNGPEIDIPSTPAVPDTDGAPIEQPLDIPDVPPLGETTLENPMRKKSRHVTRDGVALASAHEADQTASARAIELRPAKKGQAVEDVALRGEVVENDAGGGPRLIVDVEPRDATGQPATFVGALSLMLVEPAGDGGRQKLARWDYKPKEVQTATDPASGERIRFHVELPSDVPVPESAELWVQLLPRKSGRVVTHAAVNLQQPGLFASLGSESPAQNDTEEYPVVAAVYHEHQSVVPAVETEILDGGWTTALPGQPGGMVAGPGEAATEWRASSEPPPEAISTSVAAPPQPTTRNASSPPPKKDKSVSSKRRQRSTWSPERLGASSVYKRRDSAARPSWSATR
jgi:hypothetical protein